MKKNKRKAAGQRKQVVDSDRSKELNEMIRIAALKFDPQARIEPLATKAGIGSAGIRFAIRRGYFTAGQACALEIAAGRDLLPKEKLCPEKFGI